MNGIITFPDLLGKLCIPVDRVIPLVDDPAVFLPVLLLPSEVNIYQDRKKNRQEVKQENFRVPAVYLNKIFKAEMQSCTYGYNNYGKKKAFFILSLKKSNIYSYCTIYSTCPCKPFI